MVKKTMALSRRSNSESNLVLEATVGPRYLKVFTRARTWHSINISCPVSRDVGAGLNHNLDLIEIYFQPKFRFSVHESCVYFQGVLVVVSQEDSVICVHVFCTRMHLIFFADMNCLIMNRSAHTRSMDTNQYPYTLGVIREAIIFSRLMLSILNLK